MYPVRLPVTMARCASLATILWVLIVSGGCGRSSPESRWIAEYSTALERGDDQAISAAFRELAQLGNGSIPEFISILQSDPQPRRRFGAAIALGKLRGLPPRRIDALIHAGCNDSDTRVQLASLGSIDYLNDHVTDPQLAKLCHLVHTSNESLVVDYALVIIRERADRARAAIPALKDIVVRRRIDSNNTRALALETLANCDPNDASIQDIVFNSIGDDALPGIDIATGLRSYWGDRAPLVVAEIARVARSPSKTSLIGRLAAIEAIGKFRGYVAPDAYESALVPLLQDSDPQIHEAAKAALENPRNGASDMQ